MIPWRDPFCIIVKYCFFSIFKMAAARPGFLRLKFLTAVYFSDTLCIIVANFVEISYSVVEISQFFWVF